MAAEDVTAQLADLIVRLGANVQPGQIVALGSEPGKEALARAVAESCYRAGAKFVDLSVFDPYVKRARALYADPDTLDFVPAWYGERIRALGREHGARISLSGPVAPRIMEGIHPELASKDMLPAVRESIEVINDRTTNWTIGPCPSLGWAQLVHPDLEPAAALARLWGRSRTSAGSTLPIRSGPGRRGSTSSNGPPPDSANSRWTGCGSRARGPI